MEKGKSSSVENIKKSDIIKIAADLTRSAGVESRLIYVFHFSKLNAKSLNRLVRIQKKVPSSLVRKSDAKVSGVYKLAQTPLMSISKPLSTLKSLNVKKQWGIMIEGQADPINKNFQTKDTALAFAKILLRQGKGKKIVVID